MKVAIYLAFKDSGKWAEFNTHPIVSLKFFEVFNEDEVLDADLVIDGTGELWSKIPESTPVLTHSLYPLPQTNHCVVRTCLWPGFWERNIWEAAGSEDHLNIIKQLLAPLNQQLIEVSNTPGLVAPRVLATIINEAAYTLKAEIANASNIDVAMKLGTNYPEGPVEWAKRIGPVSVMNLLEHLSKSDTRYKPCPDFINLLENAG